VANNKFSKALRHLKSTELDEKIKGLNESPTNSMGGVYALNQPGHRLSRELDPAKVFYPDVDGNFPAGIPGTPGEPNYIRPAGYWDEGPGTTAANPYDTLYTANWSYSVQEDNARNTETLIDPDTGYVLSELPPNSRSFILGPLVDLYFHNHSNDNRTYVGYVQKDTREFVLLGYVNGRWGNDNDGNLIHQDGISSGRIWNGESSQFVATNSNFTFDMLQWFHNKLKAGLSVKNASFFNSGGVPIISGGGGEGQPTGSVQGNAAGAGSGDASDGNDANVGSGTGGNPDIGTPQNSPNHGGPGEAILWGLISSLVGKLGPLGLAVNSVGDILKLVDQLPALDYSKDIAMSILTGKPIVHDQSDIPQNQIDALINNISSNMIGNSIPVTNQEIPYADDNIKTNLSGKVSPNVGPNKVPNTTGPMSFNDPGPAGLLNPLHAAGQAQAQVVIPDDGSEPYFKYTDHAYYNPNSTDPGEVPDPIKSVLANLIQSLGGGLDGYPEQIKGDSIKTFEVPVSELPSNLQTAIQKELDYQNIVPSKNIKESKEVITESRKRILREIKQPYKLPEQPKQKYKMNFKGKFTSQNTPNVTASKKSDDIVSAKNAAGQTWRTKDKYWSGYESTERMNIIYDHVGHGQLYWDTIVDENRNRKNMRDREIQEHLNLIDHNKAMKEIIEQQTLDAPKDPLFKKVADRLKTQIDYPDKPSKNGYPDTPPPEMVNGFHPEYGKRYKYDKLDPHSAEAMPSTGNPEIDANVQKARKAKKLKESKNYNVGKKTLKQFSVETWSPISGSGPTNSTSQSFSYSAQNFETGQANTVTVSGLGGVESIPSTVTVDYGFGETEVVSAPTFSQLGLQGYAKPLGMNVRRRTDLKNVNPQLDASQEFAQRVGADYMMNARVQQSIMQEVETDLAKIAAKFNSSLIGNMRQNIKLAVEAILKGQQPPLVVPPDPPFTGMTHEQLVDETNKVNDRYNDLLAPLQKKLDSYAGQLAPEGLVAKINDLVEAQNKETNALYEKNLKDNQEYGDLLAKQSNEWSKFVNAIEDYRKEFNLKDRSTNYWNYDPSKMGKEIAKVASTEPTIPSQPDDDLLDQLANMFGVGSAKNFVDHYIDNFVKGDGKQDQNLTKLLTKDDRQYLETELPIKDMQNNFTQILKGKIDSQTKINQINAAIRQVLEDGPEGIQNSLGRGVTLDIEYFKKTGDFKLDKTYQFTSKDDLGYRSGSNLMSHFKSLFTKGYTSGKMPRGDVSPLIQNPMRYHVIIPGPKKRKKKEEEK